MTDYKIDETVLYQEKKETTTVNWVDGIFKIIVPSGYEYCEADSIAADINWTQGDIPIEEEGLSITKEYYVIDKRMVADENDIN